MANKDNSPRAIRVCVDSACAERKGKKIARRLKDLIEAHHCEEDLRVKKCDCLGRCKHGPVVIYAAKEMTFESVTVKDVKDIFKQIQDA